MASNGPLTRGRTVGYDADAMAFTMRSRGAGSNFRRSARSVFDRMGSNMDYLGSDGPDAGKVCKEDFRNNKAFSVVCQNEPNLVGGRDTLSVRQQ